MRVIILGSAAGGGLPQWNCGCSNCQEARLSGTGRTQSSVALSADGARWVLLNASPDLRAQVASRPELWPRGARGTAISAVVCTDGEIDHTLGLLLLREAAPRFPLYASAGVVPLLDGEWPALRVLSAYAAVGGRGGSLELLPRLGAKRTMLVHINNTNPILSRASRERAQVEGAGIEVAEDGMEVEL